ncbi:MAG: AmmeMemoRadiSam system protein B, partial [Planctomycetia bacterium]|nr:AmmeMemoRadiSam system protein B [Planctomycetia bacterium]
RIVRNVPGFVLDSGPHVREHAIEVLLPVVHRISATCQITAVTMSGGDDWNTISETAEKFAEILSAVPVDERPFLLISSDLSHYIPAAEAKRRDGEVLRLLEQRRIEETYRLIERERISMCGGEPACLALETLRRAGMLRQVTCTGYTHSGMMTGDSSDVVGYAGLLVQ